jgi:hypothetical protein
MNEQTGGLDNLAITFELKQGGLLSRLFKQKINAEEFKYVAAKAGSLLQEQYPSIRKIFVDAAFSMWQLYHGITWDDLLTGQWEHRTRLLGAVKFDEITQKRWRKNAHPLLELLFYDPEPADSENQGSYRALLYHEGHTPSEMTLVLRVPKHSISIIEKEIKNAELPKRLKIKTITNDLPTKYGLILLD